MNRVLAATVAGALALAGGAVVAVSAPSAAGAAGVAAAQHAAAAGDDGGGGNSSYGSSAPMGPVTAPPQGLARSDGPVSVVARNVNISGLLATGLTRDTAGTLTAYSRVSSVSARVAAGGHSVSVTASQVSSTCRSDTLAASTSIVEGVLTVDGVLVHLPQHPAAGLSFPLGGGAQGTVTLNNQVTGSGGVEVQAIRVHFTATSPAQDLLIAVSSCGAPPSTSRWRSVSAGGRHTCAVKTTGTLWCWGSNNNGELGVGITIPESLVPVQESTDASDWATVSAGDLYTCAVKTTGTLWCWGYNFHGQLGDGTTTDSFVPVQESSHASDWATVAAGISHTCAVKTTGTLWCWGDNDSGQLGDGTTTDSLVPVQESTDASDWASVSAGAFHTCAVKTTGTLWCWGSNFSGELGDGTTTDSLVPVQESTHASDWASVSAGAFHTCAVKTTGTLWCWGYNNNGQLGDGTTTNSTAPVQESTDASDWATVDAGFFYTCAVKTAGTLWCWGRNIAGQLGDGTTTGSLVPVQVSTHASDWATVSAGDEHTCAVKATGTLWCWGSNFSGELGDGTTTGSTTPVEVPVPTS
jgi:alpha-tubulin suppressor-like RCC1 family protein